ncbi:glyoxalase [bacterium BRH_c32]|nr:MAG: glyoxalase [bacterium BRH_c32]
MKSINPYLNFPGNTEEAFNFYKKIFGGDFIGDIFRFRDTPEAEKMSGEDKEKIMHIALKMGKSNMLMATDALESMGFNVSFGNNFYISIDADSISEADQLFKDLADGGKILVEIGHQFWADYFGSLEDKFSVRWMINFSENS